MRKAERKDDAADWSVTTREGSRGEQLRRWAALPLDRIILAIEEMEALVVRLASTPALPDVDAGSCQRTS
jgi:hypothetical protein